MNYARFRPRYVLACAASLVLASGAAILTTTAAQAATGCRVNYVVSSAWPGGFGANVTITNLGDTVTSWRLTWSFGAGQTITQLWNGSVSQSGAQVSVANVSYNGTITTGGETQFGFNGAWNGTNPVPTDFALNGTACTGSVGTSAAPPTSGPVVTSAVPTTAGPTTAGPTTAGPTSSAPTSGPTTSRPPACTTPGGGSGPYPAGYETSGSLPNHTIYRPECLPTEKLPVLAWSQGACSANGTAALNFLREIASHGFLVIANGNPNGSGSSTASWLTQSMDWAVAENARQGSKYYGRLDTSKIAVAGFSCGGLEAYEVSNDARITTTVIFSSGLLNDANDYQLRRLTKPIAYFIGGTSDIAYPNAMDDWGKLPSGLPAFMGNLNVGHGGTYDQYNGGEFGRVMVLYLKWRLKGDQNAGRNFVGSNCGLCGTQWQVQQKNLTL
ncbi:cellulose binding domain-containing protein [Luedemannella helvata]|uniref:CBM2 domain-containing protein n=1 Tax=Luedemannella helvata TaxID=349315 RepID=A0ABP4XFQ4_9ACTN